MNAADLLNRPLLIEIAWEVCNQIGGIYTVMKTKAPAMVDRWGDNYLMVGPYNPHLSDIEFEECEAPTEIIQTLATLKDRGVVTHFGHWLIPGKPLVILIEIPPLLSQVGKEKYFLWKDNGIQIDDTDTGINENIAFGYGVSTLLSVLTETLGKKKIVAHFHEWMAGVALPRIRHLNTPVATIFTTHATLLGRYIASDDANFYNNLPFVKPDAAAAHYNIQSRHAIERACAHSAHVFTTVSEVTAREAEFLLGRVPDFLLPNGLNAHKFSALHEFQNLHLQYKEKIHEFVMGHFFSSHPFDLDRTIYIFTSGRYEFRNKGMDVFIESLYQLNKKLKSLAKPPTVVAFIITRAPTKNLNVTSLQNHLGFEDLKSACDEIEKSVGDRILAAAARGRMPSLDEILPEEQQVKLKRAILARKNSAWPPIVTHDLTDDSNDQVMNHLRHRGLLNNPTDPVKVVFHPDFVSASSLLGLDYEQFVRGCHLGVFPSYYEPWGYTPLECLALGLPTVTTDLSGFGAYVQRNVADAMQNGVLVLSRSKQAPEDSIEHLSSFLFKFSQLTRRERIGLRNRAERLTERFTWDVLAAHYHRTHAEALRCLAGEYEDGE